MNVTPGFDDPIHLKSNIWENCFLLYYKRRVSLCRNHHCGILTSDHFSFLSLLVAQNYLRYSLRVIIQDSTTACPTITDQKIFEASHKRFEFSALKSCTLISDHFSFFSLLLAQNYLFFRTRSFV